MEHHFSFVGGPGGDGVGDLVGIGGPGGSVNVHITSNHIYGQGSSGSSLLLALPRANDAAFDSGRKDLPLPCLEGTRVDILKNIISWLKSTDESTPPLYWLSGIAGIGKSTIAKTIAEQAEKEAMLGASFFFSRSDQSLRDPRTVFPTLAFQLANADDAFKAAIVQALERDPGIAYKSLLPQFEALILAPLLMINRSRRATLIVLDALDECEETGAEEILRYLLSHATQIPFLRILITGRPEPHISSVFDEDPNHIKADLHDIDASVAQHDIHLYISTEFEKITKKFRRRMTADWAPETQVNTLVERSGTLFIYAATCVRFIGDNRVRDPHRQLQIVLDTQNAQQTRATPYRLLDNLYMEILRNSLSDSDPEIIVERFQVVVGSIVLLREPLPLFSLAEFVHYEMDTVDAALYHLHSVIIPPSNIHEAPRIYHPSFLDFITDPRRCTFPAFVIAPGPDQERRHAMQCFGLMAAFLKRNMAGISDPSLLNYEVDGFEEKVNNALPPEAQYACKFWASHLSHVGFGDKATADLLEGFSMRFIMWWLEAMSLIGRSFTVAGRIQEAQRWAIGSESQAIIVTMLSDAYRFILAHAKVIGESALHVYLSALPFTPHGTVLYETYFHESDPSIRVLQGVESQWPQTLGTFLGHSGRVLCVAFSPDGSRLASGSFDRSVRLWDATSGEPIASLEMHADEVYSIAVSPDGSQLASGSEDHIILLWDVALRKLVASLEGHSDVVYAIAFSPDGSRLASGSKDHSIRLWDPALDESLASLEGHSGGVTSVAFSPDGRWLASGSVDHSVWLWDAMSSKPILSLEGHSDVVSSIAFSPDSLRLASGSEDQSVQLWDVILGRLIASLNGHSGGVTSVQFSPNHLHLASGSRDCSIQLWDATSDGTQLASGSEDNSIWLWDVMSRKTIASLERHSGLVTSVTFSPDGLQLASSSEDHSIQLWDATSDSLQLASGSGDHSVWLWDARLGKPITSLEGHSDFVYTIAYSLNGSQLASGSGDNSVRLWDPVLGQLIISLEGHSDVVCSVVFSPDGSLLASASFDHSVRLWDALLGNAIASLEGHSSWVTSVVFSPDGLLLASSGTDHSIQLWDATRGMHKASLEGHSDDIISLTFSVDSHILISQTHKDVFTWDLTSASPFHMVSRSHSSTPPATIGPASFVWSYHDHWLQVQYLASNCIRRICYIPTLHLPSIEVQSVSLPTESWVALGCRDGHVIILHIQHHMYVV